MAFGLDSTGFTLKRLADLTAAVDAELRARLGNYINLLPESVLGQIRDTICKEIAELWEAAEDVYNSAYPDTASGISLDNVVALTGITRKPATFSTVQPVRLFGTAATIVPVGTVLSVAGNPTARFITDAAATLVAGTDEQQRLTFSAVPDAGNWTLNWRGTSTTALASGASAAQVQAALQALPYGSGILVSGNFGIGFTVDFAGDSGKQEQPAITVASNTMTSGGPAVTITVATLTEGVNQAEVNATAEVTGPMLANAGTLTVIETPVAGLARTINYSDANLGQNLETDEELRARRAATLQVAGAGTVEAIRSRLLALTGVTTAIVFENQDMVTDISGRPPKSFEAMVDGGDDQDIADTIWAAKPAGIATHGTETETVMDSQGFNQTIKFSRPTQKPVYVELDLIINSFFPVNGIAAAKQAIVAKGNQFGIGEEMVTIPTLLSAIATIPGIRDAVIRVGFAPSPVSDANLAIAANEVATFDTGNVVVATSV